MIVVYLDILIFINLIVNYFLLRITAFFTGAQKKRGRAAVGAAVGAAFALVVLLPKIPLVLSLVVKLAGAVAMAAVAFGIKNFRYLLRNTAYLFVATVLTAGAVFVAEQGLKSDVFFSKNLGIYIDLSPITLIVIVLAVYLLLCLFELLFKKHRRQEKICRAAIHMGEKTLEFNALLDSGNQLCDTLTGRDAVVLKRRFSTALLSRRQRDALENSDFGKNSALNLSGIGEFALLPYCSVGGQGLMLGFGAKSCEVTLSEGRTAVIDRPFVAFADDRLLGETDGIIGCDAVEV